MKRVVLFFAALAIVVGAAAQTTSKSKTTTSSSGKSQTTQVQTKTSSQSKSQATQAQTKTTQSKSSTQTKQSTTQSQSKSQGSPKGSQANLQSGSQNKSNTNAKQSGSQSKSTSNNKQAANSKQGSTQNKQAPQKKDSKKDEEKDDNKRDINHFNIGLSAAPGLHLFVNNYGRTSVAVQMKAGANLTIPVILPDLYIQPGARLALRTGGTHYTGQLSNLYLEVPVFAGFNFRLGDIALFAEAGPYAGLRIIPLVHGSWHAASSCPVFDIGLGINAGVELNNKIRLSAGFDRGFISPCHDDHAHNGGFWLTATYLLR